MHDRGRLKSMCWLKFRGRIRPVFAVSIKPLKHHKTSIDVAHVPVDKNGFQTIID